MSVGELFGRNPQPWIGEALCAQIGGFSYDSDDTEIFFPGKGGTTYDAKAICAKCPVAAECLQYALDHDERYGVWGGHSERERRRLKRGELVSPTMSKPTEHGHRGYWRGCRCDICREDFLAYNQQLRDKRRGAQRIRRMREREQAEVDA